MSKKYKFNKILKALIIPKTQHNFQQIFFYSIHSFICYNQHEEKSNKLLKTFNIIGTQKIIYFFNFY